MIQRDAVTRQLLEDLRLRCLEGTPPLWEIRTLRTHLDTLPVAEKLLPMLSHEAQRLQQGGEYHAAVNLLQAMESCLQGQLQAHEGLEVLLFKAALCRDLGRMAEAQGMFAQVLSSSETLGYTELQTRSHLGLSLLHRSLAQFSEAMYHARHAFRQARRSKLTAWQDVSLNQILLLRRETGRSASAGRLAALQLDKLQAAVPVPVALVACVLNSMCLILLDEGRPREAAACALEALGLNRGCGRQRAVIQCMCSLSDCYIRLGEEHRALEIIEEALELAAELNLGHELACLSSRVSQLCVSLEDDAAALRCEARVELLRKQVEDYLVVAST